MKKLKSIYHAYLFLLFLIAVSCRDPFFPEETNLNLNYLVIEGHIDTGGGESIIKLSRTGSIFNEMTGSFEEFILETGARLDLISEQGSSWSLTEKTPGNYSIQVELPSNTAYSLNITLRNNQSYFSEFIMPVDSPPIGSVSFERKEDGVSIFVSTQGTEDAQYFLWQYEEDWMYRSPFNTFYIYNPETEKVDFRPLENQIHVCWNKHRIPNIVLENAGRFAGRRIERQEIMFIPLGSEKLSQRYSILVKQMALEPKAFTFWETMRKNSQEIGGIFSPLPSFIESNFIKDTENDIPPTIGYLSIGKVSSERLYIDIQEVAPWRPIIDDYRGCMVSNDTITSDDYEIRFGIGGSIPVEAVFSGVNLIGYFGASTRCVDCTVRGGTTTKPEFWED
jgi:hypothetical protein